MISAPFEADSGNLLGTSQQQAFDALNRKYPFVAPVACQPLSLLEDRLQAYLSIRSEILPVFQSWNRANLAVEEKIATERGILASFRNLGVESDRATMALDARAKFVGSLDAYHMSPVEFWSITGAIYGSATDPRLAALQHSAALNADNAKLLDKYKPRTGELADPTFDSRWASAAERGSRRSQ